MCVFVIVFSMRVQKKSVEQKTFMRNFPIKFLIIARRIAGYVQMRCIHFLNSTILTLFFL